MRILRNEAVPYFSVVKDSLSWIQNVYLEWKISRGKFCNETFFMEYKCWGRNAWLIGASQVTIPNAETSKANHRYGAGRRVSEGVVFLHTNDVLEKTLTHGINISVKSPSPFPEKKKKRTFYKQKNIVGANGTS